ncbi:NAD(P)-binding Rossmann-fold-containing protein [Blastocystis sp. ATCC 50177/Nand II]|uniref:NAD(P)-binding Rossmann-fold-containing protein n=1 Tax=Blastocystis sp. subtype 1 (strain ATCC 50177 / NandII) TaxID=478820 RepID=A0A196SBM7_BLAHN|nr:NAD(P)-binding Rossmann-fold-containing protein [Blastocystis sp. ATCC 50177/Nand II]
MASFSKGFAKLARLNYFKYSPDLVVVGGNGFVGSAICKVAAQFGLTSVSLSINPAPPVYSMDDTHDSSWVSHVQWRHGDATDPKTWDAHVVEAGCTAMIYTAKPFNRSEKYLWDCNYVGALKSIDMARKMKANRFVYISTNFLPPLTSQSERETKKKAEEALMEYSRLSLETDSPISLSILKPGWVYGEGHISSSIVGAPLHVLHDHFRLSNSSRNLSSISVDTLALAAACQAFDAELEPVLKLYNNDMRVYEDPAAREWLVQTAKRIYNLKQASHTAYDYEAY